MQRRGYEELIESEWTEYECVGRKIKYGGDVNINGKIVIERIESRSKYKIKIQKM